LRIYHTTWEEVVCPVAVLPEIEWLISYYVLLDVGVEAWKRKGLLLKTCSDVMLLGKEIFVT
jgi:hypothetical protein